MRNKFFRSLFPHPKYPMVRALAKICLMLGDFIESREVLIVTPILEVACYGKLKEF